MRILLIAEACNPEWTSVPLVGWNWYRHLCELVDITLVTQIRNREAILRRAPAPNKIVFIDSERVAKPCYRLARLLTLGRGLGWTTQQAAMWLPYLYFEKLVVDQLGRELRRGQYDIIHRITPLSPVYPSPLVTWTSTPVVLGPLNGGLPWPKGTTRTRFAEMEFLSYTRQVYQMLPYVRRTYRQAGAVIAGSRHTQRELERTFGIRCEYMPENGVDVEVFHPRSRIPPADVKPFRILFVGRLVPLKRVDLILWALASSEHLRRETRVAIVGEGPERLRLARLAEDLGLSNQLEWVGSLPQHKLRDEYARSSVLVLPSLKEFGGAVVLEAMATGLPCIVFDHGGPGEYVTPDTGVRLPIESARRAPMALAAAVRQLMTDGDRLNTFSERAALRIRENFNWQVKALRLKELYCGMCPPDGTPKIPVRHGWRSAAPISIR